MSKLTLSVARDIRLVVMKNTYICIAVLNYVCESGFPSLHWRLLAVLPNLTRAAPHHDVTRSAIQSAAATLTSHNSFTNHRAGLRCASSGNQGMWQSGRRHFEAGGAAAGVTRLDSRLNIRSAALTPTVRPDGGVHRADTGATGCPGRRCTAGARRHTSHPHNTQAIQSCRS